MCRVVFRGSWIVLRRGRVVLKVVLTRRVVWVSWVPLVSRVLLVGCFDGMGCFGASSCFGMAKVGLKSRCGVNFFYGDRSFVSCRCVSSNRSVVFVCQQLFLEI